MRFIDSVTRLTIGMFALAVCASPSAAQVTTTESENGDDPVVYKMTVSPAAEARPALKYHFLTPPVDQVKGNAATLYYKGMVFEGPDMFRPSMALSEKIDDIREMPLEKLPQQEIAEQLLNLNDKTAWQPIRAARYCDHCDWDDAIREDGVATLLPQAQKMREVALFLCVRVRYELAAGNHEAAIETLADGYALAHNMAKGPTLIHVLIGIAMQGILHEQARTLMAADKSPNIYWALTDLAERQIEIRHAMSYESRQCEFSVHGLGDLERHILTPQEALDLAQEVWQLSTSFSKSPRSFLDEGAVFLWTLQLYDEGRAYLLEHGATAERLNAMPALQVVLLYRWKQFAEVRDDSFKMALLPKNEFLSMAKFAEQQERQAEQDGRGMPFTRFLPAIHATEYAALRACRQVEELRIVEALRMYAAEHGHWPETLADIKKVPIPSDPITDKPFEYSVKDDVAVFTTPAYRSPYYAARYELTLRKPDESK